MKKTLLLYILSTSLLFATPEWFSNQTYSSHNQTYYGYGQGASHKEARSQAVREVIEQMRTEIQSSFSLTKKMKDKNFKQNLESRVNLRSKAVVKSVSIIKRYSKDGRYYVVVKYHHTTPAWYEERNLEKALFSTIGYGTGKDMIAALKEARFDISSQLSIDVTSSMDINTTVKNGKLDKTATLLTSTKTEVKLHKTEVLQSEKVADSFFIAVSFTKLPTTKCPKRQNRYLQKIPLIQKANSLTSCQYDYALDRNNNNWYLSYKDISQKLTGKKFDDMFMSVKDKNLTFSTLRKSYYEDEAFSFTLKSTQSGYISIVSVYEDGRTALLLDNQRVTSDKELHFPSLESGQSLIAGLIEPGIATKDLYFALYSKEPITLSRFQEQEEDLVGSKEYRFGELIKLSEDYTFSTILVRTKPKF